MRRDVVLLGSGVLESEPAEGSICQRCGVGRQRRLSSMPVCETATPVLALSVLCTWPVHAVVFAVCRPSAWASRRAGEAVWAQRTVFVSSFRQFFLARHTVTAISLRVVAPQSGVGRSATVTAVQGGRVSRQSIDHGRGTRGASVAATRGIPPGGVGSKSRSVQSSCSQSMCTCFSEMDVACVSGCARVKIEGQQHELAFITLKLLLTCYCG